MESTTTPTDLADRLAHARTLAGWSQRDLARASGVTPAQIGLYETRGQAPRAGRIAELSDALGVDQEWLSTGKGSPRPSKAAPIDHATHADVERVEAKLDQVLAELRKHPMDSDELKHQIRMAVKAELDPATAKLMTSLGGRR